jgi:hypothetical protein
MRKFISWLRLDDFQLTLLANADVTRRMDNQFGCECRRAGKTTSGPKSFSPPSRTLPPLSFSPQPSSWRRALDSRGAGGSAGDTWELACGKNLAIRGLERWRLSAKKFLVDFRQTQIALVTQMADDLFVSLIKYDAVAQQTNHDVDPISSVSKRESHTRLKTIANAITVCRRRGEDLSHFCGYIGDDNHFISVQFEILQSPTAWFGGRCY